MLRKITKLLLDAITLAGAHARRLLQLQLIALSLAPLVILPSAVAEELDVLAPKSSVDDALTGPLHTVTISTNSISESLLFYRDGLALKVEGPLEVEPKVRAQQRLLWGLDDSLDWEEYRLRREGVDGTIALRLLHFATPQPSIHNSWNALELGTFSVGFPNLDQTALDTKMRQLGFGALNTLARYRVPRTDGNTYPIEETIFNGPDFVHAVGIHRGEGMTQLGPIDRESGYGGSAYSAVMVEDSDAMLAFMVDVLGLELRSDRTWKSAGSDGALNVPNGTVFRFSIVYSQGSRSQHMLLVDYENTPPRENAVAPRVPHRGIGMWSYSVRDLDEVLARADAAGVERVAGPLCHQSPSQGPIRVATLIAPNDLLIELFEEGSNCAEPKPDALDREFRISGWQEITAIVADIAAQSETFKQVGGWDVIEEGELSQEEKRAWGLSESAAGSFVLLANPGTSSGYLRMIELEGVAQQQIRANTQSWDSGGIFDFNVRVTDSDSIYQQLQARGWQATAEPQRFQFGPFDVTEWIARGPDGITIAMIERHAPALEGWPHLRDFSRTFNATQVVQDWPASLHFYREVLGFKPYLEHRGASGGNGANVLGMPLSLAKKVERDVQILHPEGTNEGSVELLYFAGLTGRDVSEHALPPNLGLSSLRFPTQNIAALNDHLKDEGYTMFSDAKTFALAPYGTVTMIGVRAPNGSLLEFFEAVAP